LPYPTYLLEFRQCLLYGRCKVSADMFNRRVAPANYNVWLFIPYFGVILITNL